MTTETITWHKVGDRLPDDGITVLCELDNNAEPVWPGFLDRGLWTAVDGMPIDVVALADGGSEG